MSISGEQVSSEVSNQVAVNASKELVRAVGFGLGNLIIRIHDGAVFKPDWNEDSRAAVRGTLVYLLGGSIGTLGYTRALLPLIARRQIKRINFELERHVQIFTPEMGAAHAGAIGAYFLALPDTAKEEVREQAGRIYARGKIPILPLLDVGGTKISLVLVYVGHDGEPTPEVFQNHRFATSVGDPEVFYCRLAALLASPLGALQQESVFQLISILAVGQPGSFIDPQGPIIAGAKDLGPDFVNCVPSKMLAAALSKEIGNFDVYCANDGRAQFLGIGTVSRIKEPQRWQALAGHKVAYLGLGTGLGAGFGTIDSNGNVVPFEMHNANDIRADWESEEIPQSSYLSDSVLKRPYFYGDLLSSKFFRMFMHQTDLQRLETDQELVFMPHSSAKHLSRFETRELLASEDRLSPLNALLINEILGEEIITARTEEVVDLQESDLHQKLTETLCTIADELDRTLLNNVRNSEYADVIEEVACAKRRGRRVHFIGIGKSHSIGRDLAYIYGNLGIDSASGELTGADSENLTYLHEDDLVFLISNSGRAAELLELIPYINRKKCRTVALTGDRNSPLARQCTYFVDARVMRNPHPISEAPTSSTTAALAAGTAIGMVVSFLFDYSAVAFFNDHPNLQFNVDFPLNGVRADTSFDPLTKIEDIFRRFAASIRGLLQGTERGFIPRMISLTKRILISHHNHRTVFFTGAGSSLRVAEKVAATLTSIGIDASAVNPAQLPHGDFAHVRRGDLLVIISFSGQTRHLLRIQEVARQKKVDCAAITASSTSELARACQPELCVIAGKDADDIDLVPVPDQKILSSFVNLTVGDALAVTLSQVMGYSDYAFATDAHPGGAIGRGRARLSQDLLDTLGSDLADSIATNATLLSQVNCNLAIPVSGLQLHSYVARRTRTWHGVPELMIFGMGGIGLAYLAPLFTQIGKTIWFVESKSERRKAMEAVGYRYCVRFPTEGKQSHNHQIGRVSVIASDDWASIAANALRIDTIVTSVGVANIEELLPILAAVIVVRYQFRLEEPLNVVFSENFPVVEDPLDHFRHKLRQSLGDADLRVYFDTYVGLVPAIDEAIVPEVSAASLSEPIVIEKEVAPLFIDRRGWALRHDAKVPDLGPHVMFTNAFLPLHMRKLWVHNMAHSIIGYLGYFAGYERVYDAVTDDDIQTIAKRAMRAIGGELYRRWSYHETRQPTLDSYIEWRWERYLNIALNDTVKRVCREPKRKLRRDDRLIGPANYVRKYAPPGRTADDSLVAILVGAVAAMHYATEQEGGDYGSLRMNVLGDFLNIDSELLNRAENWFADFRAARERSRSVCASR